MHRTSLHSLHRGVQVSIRALVNVHAEPVPTIEDVHEALDREEEDEAEPEG